MRFSIGEMSYDTAGMEALATGNPGEPVIYIDRDCNVFASTSDGMIQLRTPEIAERVKLYSLQPLRRALRDTTHLCAGSERHF